jgi:hypothetical protein
MFFFIISCLVPVKSPCFLHLILYGKKYGFNTARCAIELISMGKSDKNVKNSCSQIHSPLLGDNFDYGIWLQPHALPARHAAYVA